MAHPKQRIAIARIISDLIKSDNIIEREEIEKYKQIINVFSISNEELIKAQNITLAAAMNDVKALSKEDKNRLYRSLIDTANADSACVAREALIILTLILILEDNTGKYELLSYDTHGSYTNDKYVIYIEGDEYKEVNNEIVDRYDHITNLLKLWKFDFIYMPKVAERFQKMDKDYLQNIIHYMNPRFDENKIAQIYEKLTTIDTQGFVRDILANDYHQYPLMNTAPSLLINIGTSVVPYCQQNDEGHTYTEFLKIRLEEEKDCVLEEIRRFLSKYQDILTEPEYYRPDRKKDYFKYFGFYKTLFDFLSRLETNGQDNEIEIDLDKGRIKIQGRIIPMSGTELATYVLILHQTIKTRHEGLLKARRIRGQYSISDAENQAITKVYSSILRFFRYKPYESTYQTDYTNVKTYISKIKAKIENNIRPQDLGHYLPQEVDCVYRININPSAIYIIKDNERIRLLESVFFNSL